MVKNIERNRVTKTHKSGENLEKVRNLLFGRRQKNRSGAYLEVMTRLPEAVCLGVLNFGPLIGSSIATTYQVTECSLSSSLFLKQSIIGKELPLIRLIFLQLTLEHIGFLP